LLFHITEELHTKAILGDSYYLAGCMNFTDNGITLNEEALTDETFPKIIAFQVMFANHWGGVKP
jgi:hypothetical protein